MNTPRKATSLAPSKSKSASKSPQATRQCYLCKGTGKVTKSAGFAGTRQYKCSKCSGTGLLEGDAPSSPQPAPHSSQLTAHSSPLTTHSSQLTTHSSPLTTHHLQLPPPDPALDRAGRIGFYHQLAYEAGRVSIMAAVAAGIELHRAKAATEHGMFGGWLKANCEFSRATAYRYMALAEQLLPGQLPELLECSAPLEVEALEPVLEPIEVKSLTQLYFDFGICKPSAVGGKREGAGRPATREPTADEIAAAAAQEGRQAIGDVGALLDMFVAQKLWLALDPRDVRIFVQSARDRLAVIAAGAEE